MASGSSERSIVSNAFGAVTDKRVTYFMKKGWFSGGSREDVPIRQVASVRIETSREIAWGLVLIALGLVLLVAIIGIPIIAFGVLLLWGSPRVNVVTAGGTQAPVTGYPWQKEEAEAFASGLRSQLFKD